MKRICAILCSISSFLGSGLLAQTDDGLTTQQEVFVEAVYQSLFGRDPINIELFKAAEALETQTSSEFVNDLLNSKRASDRLGIYRVFPGTIGRLPEVGIFSQLILGQPLDEGDITGEDAGESIDTAEFLPFGTRTIEVLGDGDPSVPVSADRDLFLLPAGDDRSTNDVRREFVVEVTPLDEMPARVNLYIYVAGAGSTTELVRVATRRTSNSNTTVTLDPEASVEPLAELYILEVLPDKDLEAPADYVVNFRNLSSTLILPTQGEVVSRLLATSFYQNRYGSVDSLTSVGQRRELVERHYEFFYREEATLQQIAQLENKLEGQATDTYLIDFINEEKSGLQDYVYGAPDVESGYLGAYLMTVMLSLTPDFNDFAYYNAMTRDEVVEAIVTSDRFDALLGGQMTSATVVKTRMGNGWGLSDWFGLVAVDADSGWLYQSQLGWLFEEVSGNGNWYYSPSLGWLWTKEGLYPYLYSASSGWYYVGEDAEGNPQIYSFDKAAWQPLN